MRPTIIVTTYKSPRALRFCLLGLLDQSHSDFELIVAEDGTDEPTREVLDDPKFRQLNIRHLRQRDDGFRKCLLLNRAIAVARNDYIIFCDGDCIPRDDFVASHIRLSKPGCFLSGNRIDIPTSIHENWLPTLDKTRSLFLNEFISSLTGDLRKYRIRNSRSVWLNRTMDFLTYRWCVFSGSNASAWRDDLKRVNGFDESFSWSSDDRDIGARLKNAGVWPLYAKHSLVQIHLGHGHPYAESDAAKRNRRVFLNRMKKRDLTIRIHPGINTAWKRNDTPELIEPIPQRKSA